MPLQYELSLSEDGLSYYFTTDSGREYYVYFVKYPTAFDNIPDINSTAYMLNVDLKNDSTAIDTLDLKIGATICSIIERFFENNQNVALYVCDNSDSKQLVRKRKFDIWFATYCPDYLRKYDQTLPIEEDTLESALLIH